MELRDSILSAFVPFVSTVPTLNSPSPLASTTQLEKPPQTLKSRTLTLPPLNVKSITPKKLHQTVTTNQANQSTYSWTTKSTPGLLLSRHEQLAATSYLLLHKIDPLFQNLLAQVIYHKPEDPKAFIIKQLRQKYYKGPQNKRSPGSSPTTRSRSSSFSKYGSANTEDDLDSARSDGSGGSDGLNSPSSVSSYGSYDLFLKPLTSSEKLQFPSNNLKNRIDNNSLGSSAGSSGSRSSGSGDTIGGDLTINNRFIGSPRMGVTNPLPTPTANSSSSLSPMMVSPWFNSTKKESFSKTESVSVETGSLKNRSHINLVSEDSATRSLSAPSSLVTSPQPKYFFKNSKKPTPPNSGYQTDSPPSLPDLSSSSSSMDNSTVETRRVDGDLYVNQYRFMRTIGKGMYGKVKLAKDKFTGQLRAIKVMQKNRLKRIRRFKPGQMVTAYQDILVEIAIMKKLSHPNVVKLFEILENEASDKIYMVLEFATKGQAMYLTSSSEVVSPIPLDTAWKYFRDLINGLDYLHTQNIVHRDIKPENLLIFDDGRLKICDFGVAQALDDSRQNISSTKGSPCFLAPEITSKKSFLGKPLDVWAAGVSLYCFVFGRTPFTGKDIFELHQNVLNSELTWDREIDRNLKDLMIRLLHKDPNERIRISQIKEHAWVTQNGLIPMDQKPEPVWVDEEEVRGAISSVGTMATVVVRAKSLAKRLRQRVSNRIVAEEMDVESLSDRSHYAPDNYVSQNPNQHEGVSLEQMMFIPEIYHGQMIQSSSANSNNDDNDTSRLDSVRTLPSND